MNSRLAVLESQSRDSVTTPCEPAELIAATMALMEREVIETKNESRQIIDRVDDLMDAESEFEDTADLLGPYGEGKMTDDALVRSSSL